MLFQLIHTAGSTIYFVILIVLLLSRRIPRADSGAGWWSIAICFELAGRILLFIIQDNDNALLLYSTLNVLEKPFLLIGIIRFLKVDTPVASIWATAFAAECVMLLAWITDIPLPAYRVGYAMVNVAFLLAAAVISFRYRHRIPNRIMVGVAILSTLLALHWLSVYPIMFAYPAWQDLGFVIGTACVLGIYLLLLCAMLSTLIRRLLDAEEAALDLAYHAPLTGLKNKRYTVNLFDSAIVLANRPHQFMAVFYIDLDNFKPINDTAGHRVGDKVLKIVANRLETHTRSTDICARLGGDEFIIVGTQFEHLDHVSDMANKLLEQLTQAIPLERETYELGASIGISRYPEDGDNLPDLIEKADKAMYEVKRRGQSGFEFYASTPHAVSARQS
ncbi:GGDEF domain-containing protein [Aestuariispira ectoiniformans]|uniref:GGDEF domain-containing protein n=1 Tax=Aestuariispira ectoiniformans TaxID=2775080 RepID=UPI00223A6F59|nr:GGDEF domain-containing protein [Aestuariispira ectoiniformans]